MFTLRRGFTLRADTHLDVVLDTAALLGIVVCPFVCLRRESTYMSQQNAPPHRATRSPKRGDRRPDRTSSISIRPFINKHIAHQRREQMVLPSQRSARLRNLISHYWYSRQESGLSMVKTWGWTWARLRD
ncbi:hypothetical protein Bbelb_389210 [Branchiostoma belcheri]|nr:hypothetical protein Bbelb_389210 [Branchiostoma belcheri]